MMSKKRINYLFLKKESYIPYTMTYIESAIQHLEDAGLLTDEIREALKDFAVAYNKKTREKVLEILKRYRSESTRIDVG